MTNPVSLVTFDPGLSVPQPFRLEGIFTGELVELLHAYGDEQSPDPETVKLLECFLIEYIRDLVTEAQTRAERRGGSLELDDILTFLRSRPKQYNRVRQLIEEKKRVDESKTEYRIEEGLVKKKSKLG